MKTFFHLLRHDFRLLVRYKILLISIALTAVYVVVFKGLSVFGNTEKFLVMVIFNDPALLGFLFVGVMVLFEKNENTLQVLAVCPLPISHYLLSKTLSLTIISLFCSLAMVEIGYNEPFHYGHFIAATVLTTVLFSFLGFMVVAGQKAFNPYMLRAIGVLLLTAVPFLGYFEIFEPFWFLLFPTQPAIDAFKLAFAETRTWGEVLWAYSGLLLWSGLAYSVAYSQFIKNLQNT